MKVSNNRFYRKGTKSPVSEASSATRSSDSTTKNEVATGDMTGATDEIKKDQTKLAPIQQRFRHRSPKKILKRLLSPQRAVIVESKIESEESPPTKSPVKSPLKKDKPSSSTDASKDEREKRDKQYV